MRDLPGIEKEFSHRTAPAEARGPRDLHARVCSLGSPGLPYLPLELTSPLPGPAVAPPPTRWECRSGSAPPLRRAGPTRRCDLRRRVTRRAEGAAGRRYRLPARTPGSRLGGAAPAGSEAVRSAAPGVPPPGPPCKAPLGMRAADCQACLPPPSRPGRAAARAARSCTVLASSYRGCSASWPSAL